MHPFFDQNVFHFKIFVLRCVTVIEMKKKLTGLLVVIILCLISLNVHAKENGIPVIGYHAVVDDDEKEQKYPHYIYAMKKSAFEKQMRYLYENHYQTLSMKEFEDYYNGKKNYSGHTVVLTFDDGYVNFNTIVKPILKKYHFKATAFVIGKHLDHPVKGFMTRADVKNDETAAYYSHSYNMHKCVKGFDRKKIQNMTLKQIKADFDKKGADHTYFAYPFGRVRQDIYPILKEENVHLAFSYNQYRNASRNDERYDLPRYMVVSITPFALFKWMVS